MKKIYFFIGLILTGFLSQAQISKGTILLGGDFNFGTSSIKTSTEGVTPVTPSTTTKNTGFSVSPSIAKAIKDNLVLGVDLGVGYTSEASNPNYKQNDYDLGVFMRNYKYLGSRFYFFFETRLGFTYSDFTQDDSTFAPSHVDTKSFGINLGLSPGVAYSLSRRWQLEAEFPDVVYAEYNYSKENYVYPPQGIQPNQPEQHQVGSLFNISSSLTSSFYLEVGLRYMIGGK
jgi:hypothetical protein